MVEICPENLCCGCGACVNICPRNSISLKQNEEGFFFPEIDNQTCVDCQLCIKSCPANSVPAYNKAQESVYAAWALDDNIRKTSSSGGVYSVLANYILSQGGVANGVRFNGELLAVHGLFDNPEDIKSCRGSKYVQSYPGNIYSEVKAALLSGKKVLFTSTPCQVNALYRFLGKNYENLYTCDFVCHGVPSPQYLQNCVNKMTGGADDISEVTFRNLSGWAGYKLRAYGKKSSFDEQVIDNSYIKTFLAGANCRYACYSCPFARNERVADITIGDFWGLGKYKPFLHDISSGVSLLIVNNEKGEKLFSEVKDQLFTQLRTFHEAARDNHQLCRNVSLPANRADFYRDAENLSFNELVKKYGISESQLKKILFLPIRVLSKIYRTAIEIYCRIKKLLQP